MEASQEKLNSFILLAAALQSKSTQKQNLDSLENEIYLEFPVLLTVIRCYSFKKYFLWYLKTFPLTVIPARGMLPTEHMRAEYNLSTEASGKWFEACS